MFSGIIKKIRRERWEIKKKKRKMKKRKIKIKGEWNVKGSKKSKDKIRR